MSQIKCNRWCSTSRSLGVFRSATSAIAGSSIMRYYLLLILLTCGLVCCGNVAGANAAVAGGVNDSRFVYNKSQTDVNSIDADAQTNVQLLEENEEDKIPIEFYREINELTEISEFIDKMVDPSSIDPKLGIHENLKRNVERASVIRAKAANCIPEPTVVDLTPINPKNNYFPRCTRVKRCGGCCNTPWMSCQATKTEVVNYQVYRYCYEEGAKFCGLDVIPVEQHLECKCDCRVKPEDCNAFQLYQDCRCHCKNVEARSKCLQLDHKVWDEENCRCVCRQIENCTSGSYYDENQCKCLLLSVGASSSDPSDTAIPPEIADRRRFIVKAIPVESDNSTIYEV